MKKYLFLDDERIPKDVTWIRIDKNAPWQIVRSYQEAVDWVEQNGFPNVISLDHDLGNVYSGMDFAKWLVNYDLDTNTMPDDFTYTVHSMNPEGKRNIDRYIHDYLRVKEN
jgi:hypothetical protein